MSEDTKTFIADDAGERHIRLIYFLANGCTKLARKLVNKLVELSKPKDHTQVDKRWSLDDFLNEYKSTLLKPNNNIIKQNLLSPGFQKEANMEDWDLHMLCHVIITCSNNQCIVQNIRQLKNLQSELNHIGNTNIEIKRYERHVEIIEIVVKSCCAFINKSDFTLEMDTLLNHFKKGQIVTNDEELQKIRHSDNPSTLKRSSETGSVSCQERLRKKIKYTDMKSIAKTTDNEEDERPSMTLGKDEYGVFKTLQEHTKVYIDYHVNKGLSIQRFEEAKKILKQHKMLAISGPRYSGKTSLATKLMDLYSSDRCVLLQRPNDVRYIRLGDLSIVLVEDFAGKYEPNKQTAVEWYGVFDVLLPAVLTGQLSVIIVSEQESFRRCILPTHSLLRYDIILSSHDMTPASPELPVTKPEPGLDLATGGAGGHDSSSESDSESLPKRENRKPSDRKRQRIKNINPWEEAIIENDEEAITELLKVGNLPNSRQIRDAIQVFGRKSGAMTQTCRDVSRRILNRDDRIVRVEPAYETPGEDDVTFIVYLKQPQIDLNLADLEFKVVERVIGQYSSEGKDIVDIEVKENLQFTFEEADRLRKCLEKHSKTLMEKHSNLQMISASHFKSKNYGNENLKETMCVVLYVRVKGCIPLTEERLPNKLNEIPTDIREGGFEFLSHAGERHTHLKMGCEITGSKGSGTIGPFLKHEGNTYCLTAAHVLVGPPCVDNTALSSMTTAGQDPIHVYQPNPARLKSASKHEPFGSVWFLKYSKGGGDVPGIDAAAIKIQDETRLPNSGEFPESGHTSYHVKPKSGRKDRHRAIIKEDDSHMEVDVDENAVQNLKYISGKVCDHNFFNGNHSVEISKFGAVTGATRGLLHVVGTSVRYANLLTEYDDKWELHSQIEITKSFEGQIFADHGDSGAVVLASYGGRRNDLRALGLLIGKSSTGTILATPMHAILKEFGFTNSHVMAFQERNVGPSISVDSGFGQAASSTHPDMQSEETFLKRFESIEKAVTDNKIETSAIRSQVDSTKTETSAIRSQVDATKNETSAIRLQVDELSTNFLSFNTNFESFADKMFNMMPNHKSNASDKNQNSGT